MTSPGNPTKKKQKNNKKLALRGSQEVISDLLVVVTCLYMRKNTSEAARHAPKTFLSNASKHVIV